jgi:hypothetical protein
MHISLIIAVPRRPTEGARALAGLRSGDGPLMYLSAPSRRSRLLRCRHTDEIRSSADERRFDQGFRPEYYRQLERTHGREYSGRVQQREQPGAATTDLQRPSTCPNDPHRPTWR